jgi:hypothetical protein
MATTYEKLSIGGMDDGVTRLVKKSQEREYPE